MNCKPGDLAYVKVTDSPNSGRFVEVLRHCSDEEARSLGFEPCGFGWLVRGVGGPLTDAWQRVLHERPFADQSLRPIRDPGEDAQDETLEWLPVPTKEGQPA